MAPEDGPPPALPLSAGYILPPEGAAEGTCWGRALVPAIIQTVTEQVNRSPTVLNPDGSVMRAATYDTVVRQEILRERGEHAFEAVCENALTPELVGSLQRALQARGAYVGDITQRMDWPTRSALKTYQRTTGPDSDILSIDLARSLGLAAVDRATLD
ncbi:hypothetical protein ATO11_03035 [Pseudaestuariivita atlantica]|uniref:Peptidoglycan binding-like domain-containing protein n=1 Tax=Pseudaestuariivita atlantica TaxID=1317121 RepID=A0A0L1JV97_9RHOB|nr:hypothetical protein ATO11_03035 [Pseudaestuariivita atlantica]